MDLKLQPQNLRFQNVTITSTRNKVKKTILKGVSGEFRAGEVTAIMGPSGAGKSTLLNILTGYVKEGVTGSIHLNDTPLRSRKYVNKCSYILQDDNLYPTFTVYETMKLAANLKIANMTNDEKNLVIDNVLNTLQLIRTKYTKCGSLSGGQRKRLSVALELLDNRQVLFLDEPTSGLDSSSTATCVQMLHNLSREGRTIIFTVHQPSASVFEMFDQVYVLAQGNCVYRGAARDTLSYLTENGLQCPMYHSMADFLIEVANGDYGDFNQQLTAATSRSICYKNDKPVEYDAEDETMPVIKVDTLADADVPLMKTISSIEEKETIQTPSEWSRFWTLVGRFRVHYFRDWTITHLKLFMHLACAILIGLLFGDSGSNASKSIDNIGFLMIGATYLWYTTALPSVLKLPTELDIIKRETFNNWYSCKTYYLASTLTTAPINIITSLVFATISFLMTEQPLETDRYLRYALVHILLTIGADGFGMLIGILSNATTGTFLASLITAYMLAFSGFLVLWSHMLPFLRILVYFSTTSYGLEALVLSVYDNGRKEMECPESELYCHLKLPKMIIRELGMNPTNYEFDVSMLAAHVILFKVAAYFVLTRRLKSA